MRDCLQFWGRVLVRMAILSLATVFLASILTAYLILEPSSKLSQKVDTCMAEWVMSASSDIQHFAADEFILISALEQRCRACMNLTSLSCNFLRR